MANDTGVVYEVRTGGSDNNGGGFAGDAALAVPSTPAVAGSGSGGTVAAGTYYCVICYTNDKGQQGRISAEQSVVLSGATSSFTVTTPISSTDAALWALFVGTTSGGPYFPQGTGLTIGSNRVVTTTPPTTGTQPFGTDYSQQNGFQVNIDNSAITTSVASNVITFTGYTPTAADVGNMLQALTGTNCTAQFYQITAWTATTWTVKGAANLPTSGTTTNMTAKMGGALASPGMFGFAKIAGNSGWAASGTYTMSGSSNVSGGVVSLGGGSGQFISWLRGYGSSRGDLGTKPIFQPSANGLTLLTMNSTLAGVQNIEFQANSKTVIWGISSGNSNQIYDSCKFNGIAVGINFTGNFYDTARNCLFTGITTKATQGTGFLNLFDNCVCLNCTGTVGFGAAGYYNRCIVIGTSGAGFFDSTGTGGSHFVNCVSYGNTGASGYGFETLTSAPATFINCIAVDNAAEGFKGSTTTAGLHFLINCFGQGNGGGGNYLASEFPTECVSSFTALSSDPFTNAAGNDFSLNNTAGGGASVIGAGYSPFPGLSTTGHVDGGAAQQNAQNAFAPVARSYIVQSIGTY